MRRVRDVLCLEAREQKSDAAACIRRRHGCAVHELAAFQSVVGNRRDGTARRADRDAVVAVHAVDLSARKQDSIMTLPQG